MRLGKLKKRKWSFPKYCHGDADVWRNLADQCKARDGYRCTQCGAAGTKIGGFATLHAAHIKSKSRGGLDILANLKTLCTTCHAKEHPWL